MGLHGKTTSLQQIGSTVHVLTDLAIDADLARNPNSNFLGPFTTVEMDVEPLRVSKLIYLSAPFVSILLNRYLTPTVA